MTVTPLFLPWKSAIHFSCAAFMALEPLPVRVPDSDPLPGVPLPAGASLAAHPASARLAAATSAIGVPNLVMVTVFPSMSRLSLITVPVAVNAIGRAE